MAPMVQLVSFLLTHTVIFEQQLSRLACCAKFSSRRNEYARGFKQDSGKRVSLFIVLCELHLMKGPETEAIFSVVHRCQPSRIRRDSPAFSSDVPRPAK